MKGLILFAHGARDSSWALPFEKVLREVQAHEPEVSVRLAFLEFMTPSLVVAGEQLADLGCTQVDVVPLFLGAGGHVRRDLPLLLAGLQEQHSQVQWCLRPAIGEIDSVVRAIAQAAVAITRPGSAS